MGQIGVVGNAGGGALRPKNGHAKKSKSGHGAKNAVRFSHIRSHGNAFLFGGVRLWIGEVAIAGPLVLRVDGTRDGTCEGGVQLASAATRIE